MRALWGFDARSVVTEVDSIVPTGPMSQSRGTGILSFMQVVYHTLEWHEYCTDWRAGIMSMNGQSQVPEGPVSRKRILFIELGEGISGLMMALPSIQALGLSNPQAELDVLTLSQCAPLLDGDSSIARIHTVAGEEELSDSSGCPVKRDVAEVLKSGAYDVVVSDSKHVEIRQLVENCGASVAVSDLLWSAPADKLVEEQALAMLAQRQLIDPHYINLVGRISLNEEEQKWARCWRGNNLVSRYSTVILNCSAKKPAHRWAPENFICVGQWLASQRHYNVVVFAEDDVALAAMISHEIGKEATILASVGIRQFAAVASLSSLVISADTDSARVAAASGARVIALFGPTSDARYGLRPPNVNICGPRTCTGCNPTGLSDLACRESGQCVLERESSCVNNVAPQLVIRAAERLLHW